MADLSRKTRVASNTIRDVMVQFGKHDLLSEREKAALDLAKAVLTELAEAAGEAKDTVSAHEKRIREEEQARERAARIAVENSFDVSQAADLVAVLEWLRAAYDLRDLRDDVIKGREFNRLYRIRCA